MFVQWLSNIHSAPSTVKNYVSGAKNWVLEHKGSIASFISYEVSQMQKSVSKHSKHVTKRAAPVLTNHLITIVSFCDYNLSIPLAVKPCILLGHALFLRSSNLLSPSIDVWTGPHTLRADDICINSGNLIVTVCSTKTEVSPTTILVHQNPCSSICPVLAWSNYVTSVAPAKSGPAFIVSPGKSLTAKLVVSCMRQALMYDPSIDASSVSMHSLRRGAAQSAALAGVPESEIMAAGLWKSRSGLRPYLLP